MNLYNESFYSSSLNNFNSEAKKKLMFDSIKKVKDLENDYQQIEKQKDQRMQRQFDNQISDLQYDNRQLQIKVTKLENLCKEYNEALQTKERELQQHNMNSQRNSQGNLENKFQYQNMEQQVNILQEEKQQIIKEYQRMSREFEDNKDRCDSLAKESSKLREQNILDRQFSSKLQDQISSLEKLLENIQQEHLEVRNINKQLEIKNDLYKEGLWQKEQQKQEADKQIERINDEKSQINFEQKSREIEMNSLIKKISDLIQKQNDWDHDEKTLILQNNELKDINEQLIKQNQKLLKETNELENKNHEFQQIIKQYQGNESEIQIQMYQQQIQLLNQKIEEQNQQIQQYEQDNQALQSIVSDNNQQFINYQCEIDIIFQKNEQYQIEIKEQQNQNDLLQKNNQKCNQEIKQNQKQIQSIIQQVNHISNQNNKIKQQFSKKQKVSKQIYNELEIEVQKLHITLEEK